MNDFTKRLLVDVEEFPVLFRNLGLLASLLEETKAAVAGALVPEEIAAKIAASEKLYAEGIQAFRSLHQQISQIGDPDVFLILTARAMLGMPWELLRDRSGGDAKEACIAWLDKHVEELEG